MFGIRYCGNLRNFHVGKNGMNLEDENKKK